MLTHLDLFSGIGGFALACQWARIETIGFVEIDKYCQKVLREHWPNVPIVEDIRDVEKIKEVVANAKGNGQRPSRDTGSHQIQQKNGEEFTKISSGRIPASGTGITTREEPAILITAGFPCQPFSVAGKQLSQGDDRYLWPETIAVIKVIKPRWILLENVTGIINLALDTVLSDLESAGYSYETLVIPACAVNAPHRRDRIWIVGHTTGDGQFNSQTRSGIKPRNQRSQKGTKQVCQSERASSLWQEDAADTQRKGLERAIREGDSRSRGCLAESGQGRWQADWWAVEPELGRVAHGIPNRVDRLKCLGNAIVPQVAYQIIKVIAEIEQNKTLAL